MQLHEMSAVGAHLLGAHTTEAASSDTHLAQVAEVTQGLDDLEGGCRVQASRYAVQQQHLCHTSPATL